MKYPAMPRKVSFTSTIVLKTNGFILSTNIWFAMLFKCSSLNESKYLDHAKALELMRKKNLLRHSYELNNFLGVLSPRSSSSSSSASSCFSGETLISLASGKRIPIQHLRSGDELLTTDGSTIFATQMMMMLDQNKISKGRFLLSNVSHSFFIFSQLSFIQLSQRLDITSVSRHYI